MRKKWTFWDIVVLVLEILSPIASLIITCFVPAGKALESDMRLLIIGAGISIPVILLQISVTQGQNKNESDIQKIDNDVNGLCVKINDISPVLDQARKIDNNIDELSVKMNHISPVLEQVFLTGNDRIQRFAYRRFGETCKIIQSAVNNHNSGNLRPNEYYEELMFLAELIQKDKAENKNRFGGEIWAMTGFADEEWIADEGYERLWTDKLNDLVDAGIKTRRLCLIPDSVYDIITHQPFAEPSTDIQSFRGFMELLESYYGAGVRKKVTEHYIIRERDNPKLEELKGFFAIKLTNGDLHILCGETVDANGALTAQVLFDPNEIQEVRRIFELYARSNYKIDQKLTDMTASNGFMEYLQNRGISF